MVSIQCCTCKRKETLTEIAAQVSVNLGFHICAACLENFKKEFGFHLLEEGQNVAMR
jgi:hypothetical protein